ncbi:MAG: hypothetical protein KTR24_18280 [Saprospiraceae bacterium]|nr:hypothetical protein [Saprospiraceae bacterium]
MSVKAAITIIELGTHFEVLLPMLEVMDYAMCRVRVCCRQVFFEQWHADLSDEIDWVTFDGPVQTEEWIGRLPNMDGQQLVLLLTADSCWNHYHRKLKDCRFLILVHNAVPRFFPFRWSWKGASIRDALSTGKYMMQYFAVRRLLDDAQWITFLNDQIFHYIPKSVQSRFRFCESPPIFHHVPESRQAEDSPRPDERTVVLLPGTIKRRGRDYETILQALQGLSASAKQKVHLVLLGRPQGRYGRNTVAKFQALEAHALSVTSFERNIDQEVYDRWFYQARVVLAPFKKFYRLGLHLDRFGQSSISGVMNDLIRYGKRCIASEHHPFPIELERHTQRYESVEELQDLLLSFLPAGELPPDPSFMEHYALERKKREMSSWINKYVLSY